MHKWFTTLESASKTLYLRTNLYFDRSVPLRFDKKSGRDIALPAIVVPPAFSDVP